MDGPQATSLLLLQQGQTSLLLTLQDALPYTMQHDSETLTALQHCWM
jgi:hypothetical protein